jgi:hypothetical protein
MRDEEDRLMLLYSVASAAPLACGVVVLYRRKRKQRKVAFDIEYATRIVESFHDSGVTEDEAS